MESDQSFPIREGAAFAGMILSVLYGIRLIKRHQHKKRVRKARAKMREFYRPPNGRKTPI